jgi:acyl carrier protein
VLLSSVAAVFGSPGQGDAAAAGAALQALAAGRVAAGLPAVALAWGPWDVTGAGPGEARRRRGGFEELTLAEGLARFDRALQPAPATVLPLRLDVRALQAVASEGMLHPLLRNVIRPARRPAETAGSDAAQLRAALLALPEARQLALAVDLVREQIAAVGGFGGVDAVDPERGITELGLDSMAAVELRNRLGELTGLRLPTTLVFDYPTPAAVGRYLRAELARAAGEAELPGLAELARLEAALAGPLPDPAAADRLADRLRALASRLTDSAGQPAAADDVDITDRLESATSDELFDFIDNELGEG